MGGDQVSNEPRRVAPRRVDEGVQTVLRQGCPHVRPQLLGVLFSVLAALVLRRRSLELLEILQDVGCDVSADTLCSAYGRFYDPVKIDEETQAGILRALSLKYIAASMCPCFLGIDKLIDYIIDTVGEYSLDGVIYYNLRLCQVFELQVGLIRHILKENNIPSLAIKTDLGREDTGQLKTRIEAFLEMLR